MNVTRRGVIASMLVSALTFGAPSVTIAAEPEVPVVSYGGSTWLSHYPVWVGIKQGFFTARGLNVEWQNFSTGSSRISSLLVGEIQFGGAGSISAIALMASGATGVSIVGAPDSYATVEGIIANEGIGSIEQLKGKKLGVPFATSSHVLALDLLSQHGLNPETDVTLINLPASDTPSALLGGQVDAVTTWTPAFNTLKANPQLRVLADAREFSLYKSFKVGPGPDVLVANTAFVETNPIATRAFLEGYFEASSFIAKNPEQAAEILTELTKLSAVEQIAVLKDIEWHDQKRQAEMLGADGSFTKGLQSLADILVSHKQINEAPVVADHIKTGLLP
ncbi:ABC transporter substrate-binding protein [Ensifer canadensis]|uniref:ABC transporter substrate-binding protein n=1 Tax=Ensifer canadensis TaxID=555315 RepID=UPI0035E3DC30